MDDRDPIFEHPKFGKIYNYRWEIAIFGYCAMIAGIAALIFTIGMPIPEEQSQKIIWWAIAWAWFIFPSVAYWYTFASVFGTY
jgi:hypothetical protein